MWHLSASAWSRRSPQAPAHLVHAADLCEGEAVKLLRGCGGDREWWHWNRDQLIGHLRVGVTPAELARMPPGVAVDDAGETGPERPRTP